MSLSFYSLVTSVSFPFSFKSFRFPCMSCHFRKNTNFRACSFHILFIVLDSSFSSMPVHASFQFFISSDVLLFSFHFTLLYFRLFHFPPLSFHVSYFHVLPLSVHILSLSLHAMSKSSQIEYSECMTLVTMVVTIYMCEYWGEKQQQQIYTHTKAFLFVFVPFPFHFWSHSFHAFLFSCQFPFTYFHVPSISVNHICVLRSSYLISLLSFCFFMSF